MKIFLSSTDNRVLDSTVRRIVNKISEFGENSLALPLPTIKETETHRRVISVNSFIPNLEWMMISDEIKVLIKA
jgi:ribosomal protein S10